MGGRGASSGQAYGKDDKLTYGDEYRAVLAIENIKFIKYKLGSTKTPWETMSAAKKRIYVIVRPDDKLKSIVLFDEYGKRNKQIDLDHRHNKEIPHVHPGYEHNPATVPLTPQDKMYIKKVIEIWEEYKK